MKPGAMARIKELRGYREARARGETVCLLCGEDTYSPRRTRCPPCALERVRAIARQREHDRGSGARTERRRRQRAREVAEAQRLELERIVAEGEEQRARLEDDDVDLF